MLADDHGVVVEGIRGLLQQHYDVIGVVMDGRALIAEANRVQPDVIVLDVAMPLLNGLDAGKKIREILPNVKLVFLTMQTDPNLAAAALQLGPIGFVLKHSAASELLAAIANVLRGKAYITARLKPADWQAQQSRAKQFGKELTQRQREVLQLLSEGRPMKEIADILNVSEKTVMFHKYEIMKSFHIKSNPDLVLLALKHGLIST
ncbi:MAG TPA: response regulator transcription factor [Candidatus Acidoferrum sp.]|nr:response regulator transcription factor [Candidatus Acidoferrum sp.]